MCSQPGQGQEHGQPDDEITQTGRGIAEITNPPPGIGKRLGNRAAGRGRGLAILQQQPIMVIGQAAGLYETGCHHAVERDQHPRPKGKGAARRPVRLPIDDTGDRKLPVAEFDLIANIKAKANEHALFYHRAPIIVGLSVYRSAEIRAIGQFHGTIERILPVHGFQLDQRCRLRAETGGTRYPRHRPNVDAGGEPAQRFQKCLLFRGYRLIDRAQHHITTENGPTVIFQPVQNRIGDRAYRRNRRDTDHQTQDEDTKPGNTTAQFTARNAPGHRP